MRDEVACCHASEFDLLLSREMSYAELPPDSRLIPPAVEIAGLARPIGLAKRTSTFRVCRARDVTLVGYRTYVTADGKFFLDKSMNGEFSLADYAKPFAGGGVVENYRARFGDGDAAVVEMPEERHVVEEPVVSLASTEPENYGSWLFRVVPKLAGWDEWKGRSLLASQRGSWMGTVLKHFLGDDVRIVPHAAGSQTLLRDALIPSVRNRSAYFDAGTLDFYRDHASRMPGRSTREKVYLSRAARGYRPLVNEGELIAALAARGFAIVEPERLPLAEQIRIVRDARILVVPGGSGLFNAVFAANAEFVLDIEPGREWVFAHHNVFRSCGLRHTMVFGDRLDTSGPHAPWKVDVDRVIACLRGGMD